VRYDDRLISHRVRVELLQCMALRLWRDAVSGRVTVRRPSETDESDRGSPAEERQGRCRAAGRVGSWGFVADGMDCSAWSARSAGAATASDHTKVAVDASAGPAFGDALV